jgi:hypothetical protein
MDTKFAHADIKPAAGPPKPARIPVLQGEESQHIWEKLRTFVNQHAFYLYLNEGQTHGKELNHWAEALGKFLSSNMDVRESGPWFHCNCGLPKINGATAVDSAQIQLAVDPSQIVIFLDGNVSPQPLPQDGSLPLFYWAKWPLKVDPSTAAAYVLDGNITVEAKKSDPPAANPASLPPPNSNS